MSSEANQKIESEFDKLVNEIKSTVNHQLKDIFSDFLERADDVLFELANEAGSNDEQKQYFELLQGIRVDKMNLVRGLRDAFSGYLKPASEVVTEYQMELDDDDDGELSLVSQDSMEEMVLINTITGKTEDKFNETLGKLEHRLEYLAEHSQGLFAKDALSPKNFCAGFKEAISILDITTSDKLILYKLFDNEITSNLNVVYDPLNERLIEAGVLPKVKLHQNAKASKSSSNRSSNQDESYVADDSEEMESDSDYVADDGSVDSVGHGPSRQGNTNGQRNTNGQATSQAEPKGDLGSSAGYYATEESEAGRHGAPGSNGGSGQASDENPSQNFGQQGSNKKLGGYPVEKINQVISDFIGRSDVREGSAEGSSQYYGHGDVLTALTQMQADTCKQIQQEPPVVERISASEIKQVLMSTIASTQGGTITKQVDQVIEKTIDFIKLIFDAIVDDKNISDTIKALLLTLQIPVIKASMLDQGFFVNDDHPARLLLDKTAELGVGVTSNTDDVYQLINQIVQTLLKEYASDINAFVVALDGIKSIIAERAKRAEEQEKKAQYEAQKIHARKIVLWELRKCTFGKRLPSPIHQLLLKLWPTLMFNHYVSNGKENDGWVTLVTVLHELIESVQRPENNEDYKELESNYLAITIRVERELNKFKTVQQYKKDAMRALRATYKDLLESYEPSETDQPSDINTDSVADAPLASEEELNHALDDISDEVLLEESEKEPEVHPDEPVSQRDKLKLLPLDVRPGAWFQVTLDNGRIRRLKLSIIIVEDALLVFVDHEGNRVTERDAETFAEEIKNKQSKIIMNHSVFDHALTSAFESIQ